MHLLSQVSHVSSTVAGKKGKGNSILKRALGPELIPDKGILQMT